MPLLRVEHAKSSRSRCVLKECSKFILKGELRIGTAVMMPGVDEPSFKWRHLCCFTARQAKNAGSVDSVDGYDDLSDASQALVRRALKGELVGMNSLIGQGATDTATTDSPKKAKKAKGAAAEGMGGVASPPPVGFVMPTPTTTAAPIGGGAGGGLPAAWGIPPTGATVPKKRAREEGPSMPALYDSGEETWEADTDDEGAGYTVTSSSGVLPKPVCPYGEKCFRKNPSHFVEYCHPPSGATSSGPELKISVVIPPSRQKPKVGAAPLSGTASPLPPMPSPKQVSPSTSPPPPPPPATVANAAPPMAAVPPSVPGGVGVCPFGPLCFRRMDPKHAAEMRH